MQNLKCDGQEVIYETDTDTRTQRTDLWLPWGRDENYISRRKLSHTGWINNKVLLYGTGKYVQYPVINRNGKEYEKPHIGICIYHRIILLYTRN